MTTEDLVVYGTAALLGQIVGYLISWWLIW